MPAARTRVRATALLVFAIATAVALVGCTTRLPDTPPGITGRITSATPGDEHPSSFLVEGGPQPLGAVSDRAQVTVNPGTMFFDAKGEPTKGAGATVGAKVRVWFDGAVAESYPVQGTAQAVQILGK